MRTAARTVTCLLLAVLCVSSLGCPKKGEEAGATIPVVEQPAQPPALVETPAVVLVTVAAGNPQRLVTQLETLAALAGPVPPGSLSAAVQSGLIQLGLKDTNLVRLDGPAGLVVLDPNQHAMPLVAALTTGGEQAVLEGLKPAWKDAGLVEGIRELVREEVDPYGVFQGGGAAAAGKRSISLFLRFSGPTAYLAGSREALKLGAPVLESRLRAGVPAGGAIGELRLDHLRKAFAMQLGMMPQMLKQQMAMSLQQVGEQMPNPAGMEWILGWMVDKMFALVQQTKQVAFSLDLAADAALWQIAVAPEPGSFFAKILAAQKPAGLTLDAALPTEAFLSMAFNAQWDLLKEDMLSFSIEAMKQFMGKPAPEELVGAMREMLAVFGDEVAASEGITPNGALQVVEFISVRDEARARTALSKVLQLTISLFGQGTEVMGIGMSFSGPKPLPAHDGVEIQGFEMRYDYDKMPAMQADMIRRMYGDSMKMAMAIFDGRLALAMDPQAEVALAAAIDRVRHKTPGMTADGVFRSAAGSLAAGAGGYTFLSISRLIGWSLESTFAMMNSDAPKPKLPPARSGMFFRWAGQDGRLLVAMRLSADHLKEMGETFQAITQLSTGQAQK